MESAIPVFLVVLFLVAVIAGISQSAAAKKATEERRKRIVATYRDKGVADAILTGRVWQGMTERELRDSWGEPASIERKVFKHKTVQVFKYGPEGRDRFRERVTVENGIVVGWHQR